MIRRLEDIIDPTAIGLQSAVGSRQGERRYAFRAIGKVNRCDRN